MAPKKTKKVQSRYEDEADDEDLLDKGFFVCMFELKMAMRKLGGKL